MNDDDLPEDDGSESPPTAPTPAPAAHAADHTDLVEHHKANADLCNRLRMGVANAGQDNATLLATVLSVLSEVATITAK